MTRKPIHLLSVCGPSNLRARGGARSELHSVTQIYIYIYMLIDRVSCQDARDFHAQGGKGLHGSRLHRCVLPTLVAGLGIARLPGDWKSLERSIDRVFAMESGSGGLRYFSGEESDHREYRRWKQWVQNKMRTMDKLTEEAKGSFIWTLLSGRALEVVEHLREEDYQVKGGDKVLFDLLDRRWPELDRTDEIGENIAAVFALKAKEGESLRQWCARSRECFDRCARKTGVKFPEEARGWILLNCSGMSEGDRAVCLARAQGDLKFDTLSQAMRSCFPEYVVAKKRFNAAHLVEDPAVEPQDPVEESFKDVELFLTEHGLAGEYEGVDPVDGDEYDEEEAAEILAATWRERRAELNQVQKGRKFHSHDKRGTSSSAASGKEFRRSFRVQVEELKQRTRCRRCGKIGHWQRECKSQGASTSGSTPATSHAAGTVEHVHEMPEHFVCTAASVNLPSHEVLLVSSPGHAVLDSGCGKTIIGEKTLRKAFAEIWETHKLPSPLEKKEQNRFRFGNGEQETSSRVVEMPVFLANRPGFVTAAVVRGDVTLLLSRPALKKLGATLDFAGDSLTLFDGQSSLALETNAAGQYTVNVSCFPEDAAALFPSRVKPSEKPEPPPAACHSVQFDKPPVGKKKDFWEFRPQERLVIRHHLKPRRALFTPHMSQCPVSLDSLGPTRLTKFDVVTPHTRDRSDSWKDSMVAHTIVGHEPWTGQTIFKLSEYAIPPAFDALEEQLQVLRMSARQHRQLMAQV